MIEIFLSVTLTRQHWRICYTIGKQRALAIRSPDGAPVKFAEGMFKARTEKGKAAA